MDFGTPRGSVQGGRRPALVIQNNKGNASSSTTIIAAITSREKTRYPFHVEFTAEESGLNHNGTVLCEQILTIDIMRLEKRAGMLPPGKMDEVDKALAVSLSLQIA